MNRTRNEYGRVEQNWICSTGLDPVLTRKKLLNFTGPILVYYSIFDFQFNSIIFLTSLFNQPIQISFSVMSFHAKTMMPYSSPLDMCVRHSIALNLEGAKIRISSKPP